MCRPCKEKSLAINRGRAALQSRESCRSGSGESRSPDAGGNRGFQAQGQTRVFPAHPASGAPKARFPGATKSLLRQVVLAGVIVLSMLGASAADVDQALAVSSTPNAGPDISSVSGRIEGLRSDGLILTVGGGRFARPRANDKGFQFTPTSAHHPWAVSLAVVRQPMAQRCRVEKSPDVNGANALVQCNELNSDHSARLGAEKLTLRDCFAPQLLGADFTMAWASPDGAQRVLNVTLDPIGIDRLHHRVHEGTKPLMESIVRHPVQQPLALLEMLWISPHPEGAAVRIEGLSGGMPLDLAVGSKAVYEVALNERASGQPSPKLRVLRYEVELIHIGPLQTQAAVFPFTCHVRERNLASGSMSEIWFAPGFGPIRTRVRDRTGAEMGALELLEIRHAPDVNFVTSQIVHPRTE